MIRKTKQ